ncbi:MAG: ECF transporter S component, partial [Halanaerobiales bacterium]
LLGPIAGLTTGIITPLLSSFFTGMPPVLPTLPIMIVELAFYGLLTGYLSRKYNVYMTLITSMLIGRVGAGLVVSAMVHILNFRLPANPLIYIWGTITTGLPGIVIQLILIPLLYKYLKNYNGLETVKTNEQRIF